VAWAGSANSAQVNAAVRLNETGNETTAHPARAAGLVGRAPTPYPDQVPELPIDDAAALTHAAHDAAEHGQVVYLTDSQGRRLAAIVRQTSPPLARLRSRR
jgi:hypothetical protein